MKGRACPEARQGGRCTDMEPLTESDVRKRLVGAADKGAVGALLLVGSLVGYYLLVWCLRSVLLDYITSFSRPRLQAGISVLILLAPAFFLPRMYRMLGAWIASTQKLMCPACGEVLDDGNTWQVILLTGRCPKCQKVILRSNRSDH